MNPMFTDSSRFSNFYTVFFIWKENKRRLVNENVTELQVPSINEIHYIFHNIIPCNAIQLSTHYIQ